MKDNEKNLNNALSDDELEGCAGGAKADWSDLQRGTLRASLASTGADNFEDAAKQIMEQCTPREYLSNLYRSMLAENPGAKEAIATYMKGEIKKYGIKL